MVLINFTLTETLFVMPLKLSGPLMIRTPIESRMKYGFNPTNGRRRKYGFCGMDVQAALFRLCGN